ncbi:type VI secretion system baseplate subunit TssE [Chitinolyticbacter meiyuanensis]|uniref:type VI secretion system baseplate subunit TssE n=1 Tax=Chitinolyticbacter meiyuanensis TaxID=682798 RepID=UPI001651C9A3|nr:type VI secretion system baseplate subunit TssE [Chitinolyticbacter meiyuanensis]
MRFLFERLAGQPALPTGGEEPFDLAAAVAAQIQRLVATRAWAGGDGGSLLEFGLPDAVEIGLHNRVELERYCGRLARLITQYEPRLAGVEVSVAATRGHWNPWQLVVSGRLADSGQLHLFHFNLPQH